MQILRRKEKKNDLTSDKVYEQQPDYQHPLSYIDPPLIIVVSYVISYL